MADYKISLGVDVDVSDIQSQINTKAGKIDKIPIKVEIENLKEIKKQIQSLGDAKTNKNLLTLNTESLEASLKDVSTAIKDIKTSIGTLDSGSGMKSLLSSINQIGNALEKASNQFEGLNKSLNALSGKDLSLNFGINLGSSNSVARNAVYGSKVRNETLPQLKQQMSDLVKYYNTTYKQSLNEFEALQKLVSGTKLNNGDFFENFLFGKDSVASRMNGGSLASQMQAYKQYIDMFKRAASLKGLDLSSVTSSFSKSADDLIKDAQDIQTGAKEMEDSFEKLKQVFGGGNNLNIEGISTQLDSIVADLGEIKTAIQGLSSGASLDGLTHSFNRLSETLENLVSNLTLAKNAFGDGLTSATNVDTSTINKIEKASDDSTAIIIQNEKKKQAAYKATTDTVLYHAGVISRLNKAETNGRFYGSNRGTGYFGTGHYFVDSATKHELDDSYSYSKLPYTSVDISKYDNLFDATNNEVASKLHDFLRNLTRFTQGSDNFDVSELFSQFKSVFGDTIMDIKEFGSRLDQLKSFMSKSDFYDRSDSVSTQFMKSLGYGGVDTRGTDYADTRYGTVIYDLKEESILQANITDELQKQGQMLEKINYERGQVFDKDTDDKIQKQLDEQIKQREIQEEFGKLYDSANAEKAWTDLTNAQNRLQEIDRDINNCRRSIDNAWDESMKFARSLEEVGLDISDEEIENWQKEYINGFEEVINKLSQEKDKLQSEIPSLEEIDKRESQLANEAYKQAEKIVEQRHLEAQQAQETANVVVQSEERKQQAIKQTDDVVDQQVTELMQKYSIAGDKGSDSFNKIKQALLECRNELEIIKNGNFDVDEQAFGNSAAVDKVTNAISEQMQVVEKTAKSYGRLSDYIKDYHNNGYKVHIPDSIKQEYGDDYNRMAKELSSRVFTSGAGEDFEVFISQLNENLGETISLSNGAEAAFKQLYDEVLYDRQQAKAQSKQKGTLLSEDELIDRNYLSREEIYDDVMSAVNAMEAAEREIAQSSTVTTNTVSQNEERKQQAYRETSGVIENLKTTSETMRVDRSSIDTVIKDMEELGFTATDTSVKMKNGGFDITVKGIDSIGRAITEIRHLDSATDEISLVDRKITQSLTETDRFVKQQKQAVSNLTNQINQLNRSAIDQNASRPIKDSAHLDALADKYDEITLAIQRMENASSDTFVDEQNNVKALISDYKSLVSEFKNAENVSSKMKGTDFASGLDIAKNDLEKFKAQAKDFPQITATVEDLDRAIEGIGDAASLNKFNDQLRVARSELAKVKSETTALNRSEKVGINVSGLESKIADLQRISPEVDKFEAEIDGAKVSVQSLLSDLKQVNTQSDFSVVNSKWKAFTDAAKAAGIAVTETATKARTALANDIKFDIEVGNFENEMDAMRAKFNSLSDANIDLRNSVELVENAYKEMLVAANANTGDEIADRERLIQAEKQYAAALEKTNNLIKQQARVDSIAQANERLANSHKSLEMDMVNWLKKNSRAAKDYGDQIEELILQLNRLEQAGNLKQIDVNSARNNFNLLTKDAERRGKTGLTAWDKLVDKVKEYSVYLSAADVFMYAFQGLKDMFEQVKLIDSAMTELKKVTDETDDTYNQFLTNAASRAKEIGTTIDGLVESTADFARLGYEFADAQGLAEVANIYAVVGDDIDSVETATQSLISTLTAFKNEMGDMDDSEFALSIVDKMNEVANNYAISSGGIGDALQRSASSMMAANNSLDETIALITAANTVVQDPDAVGTAFKTISMRIRGAKTELEEAGLETEGMVDSTAKLRSEIMALTGVDIMDGADQFKSTYKIMEELAAKWQDLSDIQQATVTELIAGKRQGNIVSSLMNNFDIAEQALETSLNSAGSAMKEHEKWQQSLEARILSLKASWQGLSQAFLSSDFLKGALDGVIGLVDGLTWLVDKIGAIPTVLGVAFAGKGLLNFLKRDKKTIADIADAIDHLTDVMTTNTAVTNASTAANERNAASEVAEAQANTASATAEATETVANTTSAATEEAENKANSKSATTELAEAEANAVSTASELAEAEANTASTTTELAEAEANAKSTATELAEANANASSTASELAEAAGSIASNAAEANETLTTLGGTVLTVGSNASKTASGGLKALGGAAKTAGSGIKGLLTKLGGLITAHPYITAAIAVVGAGIAIFAKFHRSAKELAEDVEEATSKFREQHEELTKGQSSFETEAKRYAELSKGVDDVGKNVALTADEYAEYQNLANSIASQVPSLVKAYDDEGNAILNVKDSVDELIQSYKDLIIASNNELLFKGKDDTDGADVFKDFNNKQAELDKTGWWDSLWNNNKDLTKTGYNALLDVFEAMSNGDDISEAVDKYIQTGSTSMVEIANKLRENGIEQGKWESGSDFIKRAFAENEQIIETIMSDYKTAVEENMAGLRDITKAYFSNAFLTDYDDVSDFGQNIINNMLPNLDADFYQSFETYDEMIARFKQMLDSVKNLDDGTSNKIETALELKTQFNNGDISYGEYVSRVKEASELIGKTELDEEIKSQLKLDLNVDEVTKEYDALTKRLVDIYTKDLKNLGHFSGGSDEIKAATENAKKFLDSLTSSEYAVFVDLVAKGEVDLSQFDIDSFRKYLEEEAKIRDALNFEANIEVDTTALETLNEILAESASAMGLSTEAIDSLKAKYSDLDGYDPATLFERTANGVKVNREELEKLEKKQNDLTKSKVQEHLDTLIDKYNDVTAEIDKCTNAGERAELLSEREGYASKIEELATYQAQLEGVTGAYQDWINAQNTPEDYEGYEAVATGREDIEDEIDRGFIGNSTKKYIDLLSGEDLDGKSVDDYADAWEKLDDKVTGAGYSINDFFTVNDDGDITSKGIDRFFKSLQTDFEGSVAKFDDKTKKWSYDFGAENLEKIKEKWGIGIEAIELLLEAAASAGYDIDWDGILDGIDFDTSNFETLVSTAEAAQTAFNKLEGVEDVNFNFTATGVKEATSELEKARSTYIDLITNDDGSINLEAKGAAEMRVILATLLIQKQQLEDSNIAINIDTSGLDESQQDIANAINAVKTFREKYKNLEIAVTTGQGIEQAKTELNTAMTELQGLGDAGVDIAAKLILGEGATAESLNSKVDAAISAVGSKDIKVGCKLDETALGSLNSQVLANFTPEATVKITGIDDSLVNQYTSTEKTANGTVKWKNDESLVVQFQDKTHKASGIVDWANNVEKVKTKFSAAGTVTWTSGNNVKVNVVSEAKGTANADGSAQSGRAFARGNWGIGGNGVALGGELGQELVVRDGKFFTIGDTGAEFFRYKKNDIIFNAAQTESLFKYGGIKGAKPRGKMLASGSAFAEGGYPSSGRAFPWSATASESNFVTNRVTGQSYGSKDSDKSKDKDFEEVLDWIEVIIDRVERSIDKFDQQANNIYKSWSSRNKALQNQISEVSKEIGLQQKAYNKYMSAANGVGLSSSYAAKVRNGEINIETITDEALADKIKSYQEYYEKALDCKDAIEELKETEASLYAQRVENVSTQYDGILGVIEHEKNMLEEYISQSEAQGWLVSANYYNALSSNEKDNIAQLKKEKATMLSELQIAMESGTIAKNSEAWYEMVNAINEVTLAITEGEARLKEYAQTIQQLSWETFDILQDKISTVTEETEFLINLMSSDKLFDDNGKLTDSGSATMGLHGVAYNTNMYQADLAAKEAEKLKKQLEQDPYDTELEERYREMIALQQEYILAAQDEKEAIRDLVSEGIELEIEALEERIDKYNEALDSQKDLYDYQKKVKEQTKEIASLEKQMAAYSGDNSEEAKAKVQELKVSLAEARTDLEETEYDKYISDTQQMLDELTLQYSEVLNMRMDNIDALITDMIAQINIDATSISATLSEKADSVGYTLSDSMNTIWDVNSTKINSVITTYGEKFSTAQTTTNNALSTINTNLQNVIAQLNKIASTNTKSASTSSASNSKQASTTNKTTTTTTNKATNTTNNAKTIKVSGKINAGDAPIYDYVGDTSGERQLYRNDPIYNVLDENNGYLLTRWHKLSSGYTGWFKKSDVKAYASGAKKIDTNDMAWTQEKGREYIVRPSDGAILTPVAKGDSILNAVASNNIWDMANSPSEFIKDNLKLDTSSVPNTSNINNAITQNFENITFSMPNVHDYNDLLTEMQRDPKFEKLVLSMTIDRIAGRSSLAKGKSIR